ncbi:MAG: VOC family protein [Lentisphaeraceae bacterium]|nr:VOC family protein [Lentisphaeraceae bacterium]
MNDRSYGVIVSVSELDRARVFYRDTLGLGSPVVDSNHWIEFQLDNGLVLGLCSQTKADKLKGSAVMWVFYTTEYDAIKERLQKANVEPLRVSAPPVGLKSEVFADPEGNRFTLAEKPS